MQEEAEKLEEEKLRLAEMEKVLKEQALKDAERYGINNLSHIIPVKSYIIIDILIKLKTLLGFICLKEN